MRFCLSPMRNMSQGWVMRRIATLLLIGLLCARPGLAAESIDLALVMVTDVSRSIDDSEFELEKQGTSAAFTDKRVIAAIQGGALGRIAVAYVEFASVYEVKTVVGWQVISDAASAAAFASAVAAAPRSYWGRTSISAGVEQGMKLLAESGMEATRRVIDVCGDGTNNNGRDIDSVRDEAVEAGITINGLAIANERPVSWTFAHVQPPGGLDNWFREHVTGGPGNFVLEVRDFRTFGEAMTRKLISEIAGTVPQTRLAGQDAGSRARTSAHQ
jgi:hypothetical protein